MEISNFLYVNKFCSLNLGMNLGLTIGKYFIKIVFDMIIEIGIFETSNVSNFSNF